MPDFVYMIETRLSPEQQTALKLVQQIARDNGMNVYLTGGTVRDFFTGQQIRDLDFSVQGNALNLLQDFQKAGAQVQGSNEKLQVLHLLLPGRVRAEISSTRTERFEKPSKPEVLPGTMVEDLRRRDFSANSMALSLNPGSFALFMDPLNGVADIEAKVLRLVHNYGFYEDPSRMIRAARFMTRLGWTMEERTRARYEAAKENNYIEAISKSAIGYELEQVMHEPDPLATMRALEEEGYLKLLYPGWTPSKVDEAALARIAETRDKLAALGLSADASMANAEFLTKRMPESDLHAMQKMMPRKGFVDAWRKQEDEAKELAKRLTGKEADTPSHTWKLLMSAKPEAILYLAVTTKQQSVTDKLESFFLIWPQYRQRMPYAMMGELRITPQLPVYQKLLDEMFLLMLDGKLSTEEELRAYLEPHSPPLPAPTPSMGRRGRGKKAVKAKAVKAPATSASRRTESAQKAEPAATEPLAKAAAATVGAKTSSTTSDKKKSAQVMPAKASAAKAAKPQQKAAKKKAVTAKVVAKPKSKSAPKPKVVGKPKAKAKAHPAPKKKPSAKPQPGRAKSKAATKKPAKKAPSKKATSKKSTKHR